LDWRKEHVFGHVRWKLLPRWAHERVNTIFGLIIEDHQQHKIFWTHVLDGKRYLSHDKALDQRHGDIHEQETALDDHFSAHCYAYLLPDRRIVFIPWTQEERDKEIASGRLTQEDVQAAIHHTATPLTVGHQSNGTPRFASVHHLDVDMTDNGYIYLAPKHDGTS
jgi:hypothetical protein